MESDLVQENQCGCGIREVLGDLGGLFCFTILYGVKQWATLVSWSLEESNSSTSNNMLQVVTIQEIAYYVGNVSVGFLYTLPFRICSV